MTAKKKALSALAIFAVEDVKSKYVEVPEWGGGVYVRTMTAGERDLYEATLRDIFREHGEAGLRSRARALTVAASAVDENGKLVFTPEDIEKLGDKSASALDRIVNATTALNKLSDAKVEELAKN